jgi:DNA modification methylase
LTPAIRAVPLESLRAWSENPRTITPERLQDLKRALQSDPEMLWSRPLVALPDGVVVCGNQRLHAARELGWATIPAITADLDPQRARLWALRDNSAYGDWNETALAELLAELSSDGVELALTGLAGRNIDRILAGIAPPSDPDEAPAPPDDPESVPGQVYELGAHRLACGDARDPELLTRLLQAERPVLVWTDPPYGLSYRGKTEAALRIANDDAGAAVLLEQVLRRIDPFLARDASFYVCCPAGPQGTAIRNAIGLVGWHLHQSLVWVKHKLVPGFANYQFQHEDILYGWKAGTPARGRRPGSRWHGGGDQSSVFFVDRPARSDAHPTMKPVGLITPMLANSTLRGEAVVDPFAGSGSTLIACEQLGRRCLAVELDPAFCDVIRRRYEESGDGS